MAEETRETWDWLADGYDANFTDTNMLLAVDVFRRIGLQAGMHLLDVASGSGALCIPAARLGAHVTATDISPVMIERLAARAASEGLANLRALVMDGQALTFEDETFDVTASQFGVMLFPDLQQGLREMARVTKPGGQVVVICFGPGRGDDPASVYRPALQAAVPDFGRFTTDDPSLLARLKDADTLQAELIAAGLTEVRIEETCQQRTFDSADEMWSTVTTSTTVGREILVRLSAEQQVAFRQALDERLSAIAGKDGPAVLTSLVNIGIGVK